MAEARRSVFKWTGAREQALWLVFEGKLSLDHVALYCAISPRTLDNWVAHPAFQQRLAQMRENLEASLKATIYVSKESRLLALSEMAHRARAEFERRPWLKEVRPTKDGPVTNEHFNRDAHEAFRSALDDIAKELGERSSNVKVSGDIHTSVSITTNVQMLRARILQQLGNQPETLDQLAALLEGEIAS